MNKELGTRLDKLALDLIEAVDGDVREMGDEGLEPTVTLAQRLAVFKAVGNYYFERAKDNSDDDNAERGDSFRALKARIIQGGKQ